MTTPLAFHNDPAIKEQALARLRAHVEAGTFRFSPPWSEKGATAMGGVIEGDDPRVYADQLGYPLPLALVLDRIVNAFNSLSGAAAFAEDWLKQTPVGADLSRIVPKALIAVLEEPALCAITTLDAGIDHARQSIVGLHRRVLQGSPVDRKEWKQIRFAALAASDAIIQDPLIRRAGNVVEAAAWPGTMDTVLQDTMSARGGLEVKLVSRAIGWTDADEKRVFQIMEAAEGRMTELSGLDRVHTILEAHHAEFAGRFRQRIDHFERLGAATVATGILILGLLAASPVPRYAPV